MKRIRINIKPKELAEFILNKMFDEDLRKYEYMIYTTKKHYVFKFWLKKKRLGI